MLDPRSEVRKELPEKRLVGIIIEWMIALLLAGCRSVDDRRQE
jgi:hypothetical protein